MVDPTTANKQLVVQTTGSNSGTWGDVLNASMISLVDTMLGGITSLSLSSSNTTLSQSQCQNALLRMTGTLLANVTVGPGSNTLIGFVYWENLTSGNFTVTFTTTTPVASVVLPQSRRGILWTDATTGPRIVAIVGSSYADPIPVGTVMSFFQNAAPSGWTILSSYNDYGLRIVSSAGGVTSGGATAYSTVFAQTTTGSHALTTSEMASHQHFTAKSATSHTYVPSASNSFTTQGSTSASGTDYLLSNTSSTPDVYLTSATGGGNGHTHTMPMTVQTLDMILATKA